MGSLVHTKMLVKGLLVDGLFSRKEDYPLRSTTTLNAMDFNSLEPEKQEEDNPQTISSNTPQPFQFSSNHTSLLSSPKVRCRPRALKGPVCRMDHREGESPILQLHPQRTKAKCREQLRSLKIRTLFRGVITGSGRS